MKQAAFNRLRKVLAGKRFSINICRRGLKGKVELAQRRQEQRGLEE